MEIAPLGVQIQRLFSIAVASEQQALARLVPDGEGEAAAQVMDDVRSPALIGAEQYLGIRALRKPEAVASEPRAQHAVVVYLAVEHQGDPGARVAHRLRGALGTYDRQPAVAQGDVRTAVVRASLENAAVVRPTMTDAVEHRVEGAVGRRPGPYHPSCEAAHSVRVERGAEDFGTAVGEITNDAFGVSHARVILAGDQQGASDSGCYPTIPCRCALASSGSRCRRTRDRRGTSPFGMEACTQVRS